MKTEDARALLVEIACRNVGKREITSNRAPWIKELWPTTSYPIGYEQRSPYCAAGMCWAIKTWIEELRNRGELVKTLGKTGTQAEQWRCKYAGAWRWMEWAESKGVLMLPETAQTFPGDFMVFDMSHIGMVVKDNGTSLTTVEYNTNEGGSRDGDGCMMKRRQRSLAQRFIRILP